MTNPNEIEAAVGRIREMIQDPATISFGQHSTRRINEDLHILIEAASARGVADGWRDIESAPKDGTDVLLRDMGRPHIPPFVAGWSQGAEHWCDYDAHEPGFDPSHWMPLPAAPSSPAATPEVESGAIARVIREQSKGGCEVVEYHKIYAVTEKRAVELADAILALFRTLPAPAGEGPKGSDPSSEGSADDIDALTGCADDQGLFAQPDMDEPAPAGEEKIDLRAKMERAWLGLSDAIPRMQAVMEGHPFWRKARGTPLETDLAVRAGEVAVAIAEQAHTTGFIAGRDAAAGLMDERAAGRRRLYAENNASINAYKAVEAEDGATAIRAIAVPGKDGA